jgi:hypothetical protein
VICKVIFFPNFQRKNDAEKEYQRVGEIGIYAEQKGPTYKKIPLRKIATFLKRLPKLQLLSHGRFSFVS